MKKIYYLIIPTLLSIVGCNQNTNFQTTNNSEFFVNNKTYKRTFNRAKVISEHNIYINYKKSFYANCPMSYIKDDLQPNLSSCSRFKHRKNSKANGLDWEHVIPASRYGQTLPCWNKAKTLGKNSRVYCAKTNSNYLAYESDLHNLVPAIAEINRDRKNYSFNEIRGGIKPYGDIDFTIDFKNKIVEPRVGVKGDIARIALYMNSMYDIKLTPDELKLFENWNKKDPVSKWEIEKNNRVGIIQGNKNSYVY